MASSNRKLKLTIEEFLATFGPGLTVELLRQAVAAGEGARNRAHKHDPPGAGGYDAYRFRIRSARIYLAPFGWKATDELGCAMVRNPAGDRRIVIARGDDNTGLEDLPTTFYRKGRVLRQATETNLQMSLPGIPEAVVEPEDLDLEVETWVLLVLTEESLDEEAQKKHVHVRWELSMPISWANDRPSNWVRHVLPEFDLEFDLLADDVPDFAAEDDLDIPLLKKKKE